MRSFVARWMANVMFQVGPPPAAKWSFGTASVTHSNVVRHGAFSTSDHDAVEPDGAADPDAAGEPEAIGPDAAGSPDAGAWDAGDEGAARGPPDAAGAGPDVVGAKVQPVAAEELHAATSTTMATNAIGAMSLERSAVGMGSG